MKTSLAKNTRAGNQTSVKNDSTFVKCALAVNSSLYSRIDAPNRLYYGARTVAKNSLLVLRPGETIQPNERFEENVSDGGQRLTLPTGSSVDSVAHWRDNLDAGMHLNGGEVLHFARREGAYAYVASDLTRAYDTPDHDASGRGGKVSKVRRALFYDQQRDALWVSDEVVATDPAFTKKWLLHSIDKPRVEGARVLRGEPENGILETAAGRAEIARGRGRLVVHRLLPGDGVMRVVGGADHRYYVEADGDDSDLDGINADGGAKPKPWFDAADWRLELQPATPRRRDRFLVALLPSLDPPRNDTVRLVESADAGVSAAMLEDRLVVFLHDPSPRRLRLALPAAARRLFLLGLGNPATITDAGGFRLLAPRDGVAEAELELAAGTALELELR